MLLKPAGESVTHAWPAMHRTAHVRAPDASTAAPDLLQPLFCIQGETQLKCR